MDGSRGENASAQSLSSKWSQFSLEFPDDLNLRMRRAISWLERAERESDDPDAAFIFFWIAFNAAYAEDEGTEARSTERTIFAEYFDKLIAVDEKRLIYEALWERFTGPSEYCWRTSLCSNRSGTTITVYPATRTGRHGSKMASPGFTWDCPGRIRH